MGYFEELEQIYLPNTPYFLNEYTHGRCHIFALGLHEAFGYDMEFLWDVDYWIEGLEHPSTVLVHAYCVLPNGQLVDARGRLSKKIIQEDYECNTEYYVHTTLSQLLDAINQGQLEKPFQGELKAIRTFIGEHMSIYQ